MGLISNWSPRLPLMLDRMDLTGAFDVVVCSAIERLEKPQPAIFELALARAGVAAEDALHAGDHPEKDCAGAIAVGMRAALVDHAGSMPAHANARYARTLDELLATVTDLSATP